MEVWRVFSCRAGFLFLLRGVEFAYSMKSFRKHGKDPVRVVAVHGGPGAPGSVSELAKGISADFSVLEPFQTKDTIDQQVKELYTQITGNCKTPVILIGWSWGAWLAYVFAARHPRVVCKLILVSSGPFKEDYVKKMKGDRLSRFTERDLARLRELEDRLQRGEVKDKDELFDDFGKLYSKVDNYELVSSHSNTTQEDQKHQFDIYNKIWSEASGMRKSGKLLELGENISCETVAIHGDYDPHPFEGVKAPLNNVLSDFRFVLLKKCGHEPWLEKHARKIFFKLVNNEIKKSI